jgi:CRISPR associated protein Cas1
MQSGDWSSKRGKEKLTPWQDGARTSPRVFVLGAYAALRVRGGALEIEHGPRRDDRRTIRIDIDADPKPHTLLFDSHGEFLTGEAIRWCARYSINLALPGGPGRLITMVESALETKTNTKTRMRDIDPAIIRAQCAADPIRVAREIVRAKVGAELKATIPDARARQGEFEEWDIKLNSARSVAEIMIVESRAAASYWRTFRDAGLRERKNGNLPRSWLRFAQRNKGAAFLGNQHASHPINAMLNYIATSSGPAAWPRPSQRAVWRCRSAIFIATRKAATPLCGMRSNRCALRSMPKYSRLSRRTSLRGRTSRSLATTCIVCRGM